MRRNRARDHVARGEKDPASERSRADFRPVPNVILRLDNRVEVADTRIFTDSDGPASSKTWFATTLGVVVSSNP